MNVKIYPRSINDRGGIAMMPMRVNVPNGRAGWKLIRCPKCGSECWELPQLTLAKARGAKAYCTMCVLKEGAVQKRIF